MPHRDHIKTVILLVLLASPFGCSSQADVETAATMKNKLSAAIPIGTSLAEAESRLKARGFTVSDERNSSWADKQHLNYLYGDLREGGTVQRRWQVAIFYEQDATTGIDVSMGLVGP